MQSCEITDDDLNLKELNELNIEVPNQKESTRIKNKVPEENDSDNLDNGDDDDPPRDKQHWRIEQDSVGNKSLFN